MYSGLVFHFIAFFARMLPTFENTSEILGGSRVAFRGESPHIEDGLALVCILGVKFDSTLSFRAHVKQISKTSFFHLKISPD